MLKRVFLLLLAVLVWGQQDIPRKWAAFYFFFQP